MRPIGKPQSALRTPLNAVLGTEANVRLLRALERTREPLSGAQLARETALTPPGVYPALEDLREIGIVERLGLGSRGQFRLNDRHPLAGPLKSLFAAERQRVDGLVEGLRRAAEALLPHPRSVWWYGQTARGTDKLEDPVYVAVVAGAQEIGNLLDGLRHAVTELVRVYDVTIEVRGLTDADLSALVAAERAELAEARTLFGLAPDLLLQASKQPRRTAKTLAKSHADNDQRLLDLAAAVARKLDRTMVDEAVEQLRRRLRVASSGERRELHEWEGILTSMSLPRLRRFLVDQSPRATRLRQTLPFLDILSATEHETLFERRNE